MRILIVSVFSNHLFNWVLQLKESGHEVHWFDLNDANTYVKRIDFVHQTVKWKRIVEYPGRFWLKKNLPRLETFIEKCNQRDFIKVFKEKFNEIKPDIVHSFEMQTACIPILEIMNNYPNTKWIYSPWGTDLYYYQNDAEKLLGIKMVFKRLNYMFSDCNRDFLIAKKQGFKGEYLGTFPGGGGYNFHEANILLNEFENRKNILIKGYQSDFGRCNIVLEALLEIQEFLKDFEIIVFAASKEVFEFVDHPKFKDFDNLHLKGKIGRGEVLELMGKSIIYIGNSISDGMPNTLLESIVMEAFPIQSNPGGASAEIIEHGKNGFLIENTDDLGEIAALVKKAIQDKELLKSAIAYNNLNVKPKLERKYIRNLVLEKYNYVGFGE